jgi:hypothetical protein
MSKRMEEAANEMVSHTMTLSSAVAGIAMTNASRMSSAVVLKFCELLSKCETIEEVNELLDKAARDSGK